MQINGKSINPALSALTVGWPKHKMAILDSIHIVGSDGQAVMTRTDMEVTVSVNVPGDGNGLDCHVVNGKALKSAIGKLKAADTVTLEDNGEGVTVDNGSFAVPLNGSKVDDYPRLPILEEVTGTITMTPAIADLFRADWPFTVDDARYSVSGAQVTIKGSRLRMTATDGHRLATQSEPCRPFDDDEQEFLIPATALNKIKRLKKVTWHTLEWDNKHGRLIGEDTTVTWRHVEGTFPKWERVIPQAPKHLWEVEADDLAKWLEDVGPLTSERSRGIALIGDDGPDVKANIPRAHADSEDIQCSAPGTLKIGNGWGTIGFNGGYLLDAARSYKGQTIGLHFTDHCTAVKITGESGRVTVIMPMRI